MLKRRLVKAGLFCNSIILIIAGANGTNHQQPVDSVTKVPIDPVIRQLQAFDSSFAELSKLPAVALTNVPKIRLNSRAVKFVNDYTKENTEALEKIKARGELYFPMMDSIFRIYHLPTELKYLAVVESELKQTAVSRVGALGPWQLMTNTARDLRLKIIGKYDERRSYCKSTVAAAKYLRDLYNEFGDWLLVIAAYNSGPGKVIAAIKNSGSRNFWVLQNYLPAETKGHVKRFIATHYYFEDYGSVTTLTKAETVRYKNAVHEFIAQQKIDLEKGAVVANVTNKGLVQKSLDGR